MITTKTVYRVPDVFENFNKLDDISQIPSGVWCTENEDVSDVALNAADQAAIAAMGEDYAPVGETNTEALIKDGATNVPKSILQNAKACDKE